MATATVIPKAKNGKAKNIANMPHPDQAEQIHMGGVGELVRTCISVL
jgi:hypothetical protein